MTDSTMACTQCGHPNPDSARFCASCGQPVQRLAPEVPKAPKGPSREEVKIRLERLRETPRYQEAMGLRPSGTQVLSHRVQGRRNGFLLLALTLLGFVLYRNGVFEGPLERMGPGPLFALGAFGLFVLSRSSRRTFDMRGPGQSREAMVLSKRHLDKPQGPGRPAGYDSKYYVTLMDRQGVQEELSTKRALYESLATETLGAAYIKGRTLLHFEAIPED